MKITRNPTFKIPPGKRFAASPTSLSHHSRIITIITQKLYGESFQLFKNGPFGHLLAIKDMVFSCQLAHALLLRQTKKRMEDGVEFLIGHSITSFCEPDFALVTGLRCGPLPDVDENLTPEGGWLKERYFHDDDVIPLTRLEEVFLNCNNEDDSLRLALVLFAEGVLHGRETNKPIHKAFLSLVEDIETFESYPWGSFSWNYTFQSIREGVMGREKGVDRRHKDGDVISKERYSLKGFPMGLQAWAYEVIPDLERYGFVTKNKNGPQHPRIITWTTPPTPPRESRLALHIFEVDPPTKVVSLVPTPEETQLKYWTWGKRYKKVVRISSQHASHVHVTSPVSRDGQQDSVDGQLGTGLDLIRKEVRDMKTMMAKQMKMLSREVQIIKSRLPARKSSTLTRCGRKERQEAVVGKDSEKGDDSGDEYLSNRTHLGRSENYGWDIDDHDMYQRKNSHTIPSKAPAVAIPIAGDSEAHKFGKTRGDEILAKFRQTEHDDVSNTTEFKEQGSNFEVKSVGGKRVQQQKWDNARGGMVENEAKTVEVNEQENSEKCFQQMGEMGSCDVWPNSARDLEGDKEHESDDASTPDAGLVGEVDIADSMCQSLKKAISLRKIALEQSAEADLANSECHVQTLASTSTNLKVTGTRLATLDHDQNNTNQLLSNEEQLKLDAVVINVVDGEESNNIVWGDSMPVGHDNRCPKLTYDCTVGSSHVEIVHENITGNGNPEHFIAISDQMLRRSIRKKRPGPQLLSPFANAYTYKKRKIGQYNPLSHVSKKLRDGIMQFIEKWQETPCGDVNVVGNLVEQQFILDLIEVGKWLSFEHINIGLQLLRKRQVDFPEMFGKNWTTVDHSFAKFVISDYNRYKDATDMSTWSPDARLEEYVRGNRPVFSQPWKAVDIIYVPFNLSNKHWVAIVVHMDKGCMIVYDSKVNLHTDSEVYDQVQPLAYMLPHLLNKSGLKAKGPACSETPSPWHVSRMENVPQQSNDDCGVYTIKFIDCMTAGFDMANWSCYDIKDIRVRLAVEFLCGSACL